jgi:hypothetical protein
MPEIHIGQILTVGNVAQGHALGQDHPEEIATMTTEVDEREAPRETEIATIVTNAVG